MHPEDQRVLAARDASKDEILRRLRTTNGHLRGVIAMVEAGEPCEAVLHQLGAVQAALRCARRVLIQCQLEQSVDSLLSDSPPETRAQTVVRLSNLYSLLIKTQDYR